MYCEGFCFVPRAGIEPARLAALVFETNASTNSAIWAQNACFCGAKVEIYFELTKFFFFISPTPSKHGPGNHDPPAH